MLHIIASTKGGAGKSNTAVTLACVLAKKDRVFRIIEFDDNNNSLKYSNSDILNEVNSKSLKLKKKGEAISDMLFDLMSDENIDYIIDIGGGNDTFEILDAVKGIDIDKTYYIPLLKIKKFMQNAHDTFVYINDPDNTVFVLNQYSKLNEIKNEFLYFFGSEKAGVKKVSEHFKNDNYIAVPFCNHFQIAEDDEMTIYDLASISQNLAEAEARKMFFEKAQGNRNKFHKEMTKYWNSQEAVIIFDEIVNNFWNLELE